MSGFRLKLNRLKNIPYASFIQKSPGGENFFEAEYFFEGYWSFIIVKPVVIDTIVIFLVHFPEGERDSMALVYNTKDAWSDIEKESTGLTEVIGAAIENYYSSLYLPWWDNQRSRMPEGLPDDIMLN